MADPFLITTIISGAAAAYGWIKVGSLDGKLHDLADRYTFQRERGDRYRDQMLDLQATLAKHDQAEAKRRAQRLEASAKAAKINSDRARAKREADAAARPAAVRKTISELSSTKMRSRPQVVAPVKAARTRAQKNSGAGVAAKQG